jgi:two-component system sensor histidine kinase SenX3
VVLDPSNNVLTASSGALAFGLVGNRALVHPELVELVDRVRREGDPVTRELALSRGPFGEARLRLLVRVARLGSRFVLVLAEDRTEAHRLEEVRRDFVANISHELKTPIGAVGLLAEALASAADEPAEVRRFAGRLAIEADRLGRLTHEIIELSRLQATYALDHGLGQRDIRVVEGGDRVTDRARVEGGVVDETVLHLSQLLLEHLAHG